MNRFRMHKYKIKNSIESKIQFKKASSILLLEDVWNEETIHKEYIKELNATFEIDQGSSPLIPSIKVYIRRNEDFDIYRFKIKNMHPIFKEAPDIVIKYLKQLLNEKPDDTYLNIGNMNPETNLLAAKVQYNIQVVDEWPGLKPLPLD